MSFRANYALVYVGAQLGPEKDALEVDWAEFVGDKSPVFEFDVPTADTIDAYLTLQAFDVGAFGHQVLINDESLGGFDIPPNEGWQYWMDALTEVALEEGTNTIQIVRDTDTDDSFVVGNVTVHWREPIRE